MTPCPVCGHPMVVYWRGNEGVIHRCPNPNCEHTLSTIDGWLIEAPGVEPRVVTDGTHVVAAVAMNPAWLRITCPTKEEAA